MNAAASENQNEWMSIQETFENIYEKNEAYLVQMKRYLLRLLLAGRQLNDVQAQLKLLNIDFEEKWISVLRIRFCGNIEEDLDFLVEEDVDAQLGMGTVYQEIEKVGAVSEKIGYANVSHFIRVFKGLVGMIPAEYQNRILEET